MISRWMASWMKERRLHTVPSLEPETCELVPRDKQDIPVHGHCTRHVVARGSPQTEHNSVMCIYIQYLHRRWLYVHVCYLIYLYYKCMIRRVFLKTITLCICVTLHLVFYLHTVSISKCRYKYIITTKVNTCRTGTNI